jgi:hypothetical protein
LQRDGSQGTVVIILIVVIGRMEDAPVTPLFGPGLAASLATTLFFGHWFQKHHVLPVDGMTRVVMEAKLATEEVFRTASVSSSS